MITVTNLSLPIFLLVSLAVLPQHGSAEQILKKGDRLAIAGDSITEQKLYSKFIETYLLLCAPELDIKVIQLGWSGETAPGFADRLENDLMPWKPTVVTTCYGMNDGRCVRYEESIGKAYETGMRRIITNIINAGTTVIVGSPGVVDSYTFKYVKWAEPSVYNANLGQLREISRRLAGEYKCPFADVYGPMMSAMTNAKAVYGPQYHVAGSDGIHPRQNGQLLMAYAFLRSFGLDGNIGTITVDFPAGASATKGHSAASCASGTVEVVSSRYPFCFSGGSNDPDGTISILPFVPFQQELNRFTLIVRKLPAARAEICWGGSSRKFSREQLEQGINLAAEFTDNPFSKPFFDIMAAVDKKQKYETIMIKEVIHGFLNLNDLAKDDSAYRQAEETLRKILLAKQEEKTADLKAMVKPVRHRIEIIPCKE